MRVISLHRGRRACGGGPQVRGGFSLFTFHFQKKCRLLLFVLPLFGREVPLCSCDVTAYESPDWLNAVNGVTKFLCVGAVNGISRYNARQSIEQGVELV